MISRRILAGAVFMTFLAGCSKGAESTPDPKLTSFGTVEVTAKLIDVGGEFPPNDLYDYAHVMQYEVLEIHRGQVSGTTIFVGHYNPRKARTGVGDERSGEVGGNVTQFVAGDVHRMALAEPIDEQFMGGIVNKLPESEKGPIYWAIWTNRANQ